MRDNFTENIGRFYANSSLLMFFTCYFCIYFVCGACFYEMFDTVSGVNMMDRAVLPFSRRYR